MAKVSIVTIVRDNSQGLERTLKSLTLQNMNEWESLIVVAKSSDDTLEVAQKWCSADKRIKVIIQTGYGIYEAMNEGVKKSRSKFLWFMNAGDTFYTFNSMKTAYCKIIESNAPIIIGNYIVEGINRKYITFPGYKTALQLAFSRRGICHQAMIFDREQINKNEFYEVSKKLCADYKLILEAAQKKKVLRIGEILCQIEPNGISDQNLQKMHFEKQAIRNEIFESKIISIIGQLWMCAALIKNHLKKHLLEAK